MRESAIAGLVQARFLVAGLGETATPPWWRSQATGPVGRGMLGHVFPRTVARASFETASRAARIEHDAHIGRVRGYHLFRLPPVDEAAMHEFLQSGVAQELLESLSQADGFEGRLSALGELAGDVEGPDTRGPVQVGTGGELGQSRTLRRICAAYHRGFREARTVYPYVLELAQ